MTVKKKTSFDIKDGVVGFSMENENDGTIIYTNGNEQSVVHLTKERCEHLVDQIATLTMLSIADEQIKRGEFINPDNFFDEMEKSFEK